LLRKGLFILEEDIHWVDELNAMQVGEKRAYEVRIRYRQPLFKATLKRVDRGLTIIFSEPQKAVAKGQFAAWYKGEELVGSGVID
jgi:tRNA-specific 2-thiouridylase